MLSGKTKGIVSIVASAFRFSLIALFASALGFLFFSQIPDAMSVLGFPRDPFCGGSGALTPVWVICYNLSDDGESV